MMTKLKKYSVIIQGEILNRNTMHKDSFFHTCRSKTEYNNQINSIYNIVLENPEFTISIMIRRGN